MKHRPEYQLDFLRMMEEGENSTLLPRDHNAARDPRPPKLRLPWLRTCVIDLSRMISRERAEQRVAKHSSAMRRGAVERVQLVKVETNLAFSRHFVSLVCRSTLRSLDMRGCQEGDTVPTFLNLLALTHPTLRRLYLPPFCTTVAQSTLDRFAKLEELDATGCVGLTSVEFCKSTLRVLYANDCRNLNDEGLRHAIGLEVLHVARCKNITDVSPFEDGLVELDISGDSGVPSAGLSDCRRLRVLHARKHRTVHDNDATLRRRLLPQLRELSVCYRHQDVFCDVPRMVSLCLDCHGPLYAQDRVVVGGLSLRRLEVVTPHMIHLDLIAVNLVYLGSSECRVTAAAPSRVLLELAAGPHIDEAAPVLLDGGNNNTTTHVATLERQHKCVITQRFRSVAAAFACPSEQLSPK
jgi:hypothetical protein